MPRKAKSGDTIGKYRIEKEINSGAMAVAYKATCAGETVFFKQYKSPTPTVPWYQKYVEYQQEIKRRVESTNAKNFSYRFVEFFEASFGCKNFFQVFEWVEGGKDLEHFLKDARVPGKVSWEQRLTLARVMMAGINAVHEAGIVHCDLKPPNIVLFEDKDIDAGYRLKVIDMDFSILKDQPPPWHGTDTGYVGTPLYFSPEHLRKGFVPIQPSDIFTCGLILYELLTGLHPYPDEDTYLDAALNWKAVPPKLLGDITGNPDAHETAVRILYQCLCPDAPKRPSAKDVNFALRGKFEGVVPPPLPPAPVSEPGPAVIPAPIAPPPPLPPSPPLPPESEIRSTLRVELVSESGKTLMCGIRTDVGKHICGTLGEDAKFMSDVQFTVETNATGTSWVLSHNAKAKNQTLINGAFQVGPTVLKDGDVVSVGNAAKGIVKLPMTVRLSRSTPAGPFADLPPGTITNSIGMKLVPIPAGEFLMGSAEDCPLGHPNEEFQHRVRITKPFLLGMHQITQAQYEAIANANPSFFKGPDLPVEHLSWKHAKQFCELLSSRPAELQAGRRYRLPTEAEWEYACRAGTTTPFNTGDKLDSDQARFATTSRSSPKQTAPVGSYPPNAWGLFDMHGNVWEWTSDWFSADYFRKSPVEDPRGPDSGTHHTLRGGSASVESHECLTTIRGEAATDAPDGSRLNRYQFYGDFGLRVVCEA